MKEASERRCSFTRQLLVFGRKQPLVTEDVDLNQLVADLLKMLRRLIGEHINVDFIRGISWAMSGPTGASWSRCC